MSLGAKIGCVKFSWFSFEGAYGKKKVNQTVK